MIQAIQLLLIYKDNKTPKRKTIEVLPGVGDGNEHSRLKWSGKAQFTN